MAWRLLVLLTLAVPLLAGCAPSRTRLRLASPYKDPFTLRKGQILHLATGRILSESECLDYLCHYRVVFVGETHDNRDDHTVELEVLKGLEERAPGRIVLGLEMLPRRAQVEADAFIEGGMDEQAFAEVWTRCWGHSFPYYAEILRYVREHRIRILALNVDADLLRAVRGRPLERIDPELARRLPEMDLDDPHHRALIRAIYKAHSMGPRNFRAFYRVQVLWDETMAETAARYLESPEGRSKHLVIFTGGNHVRYGLGIPRRLFRRLAVPYVIVMPFPLKIPEDNRDRLMHVKVPPLPMPPADLYWAVGYTDLGDKKNAG